MAPQVGNTKRPAASKKWCFTFNSYTEIQFQEMAPKLLEFGAEKFVFQEEDEGTPHLQGFVVFKKKLRPLESQNLPKGIHWEKTRSEIHSIKYCSSELKRKGRIVTHNIRIPREVKKVTYEMLRPWQRAIADKFKEPADMFDRSVNWYWESEGGFGKTILSKFFVDQCDALVLSGKATDCFYALSKWIDEKGDAPMIIVMDIPRSCAEYVSYQAIEKIKDGLLFSGKYEGGQLRFNPPHLICFANEEPDYEKLSGDRWVVTELRMGGFFGGETPPDPPGGAESG